MQARAIVFLLLQSSTLVLHAIVQYTITKANLTNKQYYLIRILSIFDSLFSLNNILAILMFKGVNYDILITLLFLSGYLWMSLSLHVTSMIAIDRMVAVKYCLRYHRFVTKRRINATVAICGLMTAFVLSCLFYIEGVRNLASDGSTLISSRDVMIYITIVRSGTFFAVISLGKISLRIRNRSEAALERQPLPNIHGLRAERLDIFRTLKRSIRDVIQLNFWTCMFIFPMAVSSLLMATENQPALVFRINVFATSIYALSNPVIYLTAFTPLRRYWKRWLNRANKSVGNDLNL